LYNYYWYVPFHGAWNPCLVNIPWALGFVSIFLSENDCYSKDFGCIVRFLL
jgi:hypothetical protein